MVRNNRAALTAFLILFQGYSIFAGTFTLVTKHNEEIEESLQSELSGIGADLLDSIVNENYASGTAYYSESLLNAAGFDPENFGKQIHSYISNADLELFYQYHSRIRKLGEVTNATIFPAGNGLIINQALFETDESYALLYRSANEGVRLLIYIYFNRYSDGWKITNFHVGNYSMGDMTPPVLYENLLTSQKNGNTGSALFYSIALMKIIRPADFLQYRDEDQYRQEVQNLIQKFQSDNIFPLRISDEIEIYNLDINSVPDSPIMPTIKFVTGVELEKESLEEAIIRNMDRVNALLPGITDDFESILFQAFSEPPTDPNKQYNLFGVIIDN